MTAEVLNLAVIGSGANPSTATHETGHILGLDDTRNFRGDNLMDWFRPDDPMQIKITPGQAEIIKDALPSFR